LTGLLEALSTESLAGLAGFFGGLILGFVARWGRFCSLGAIEDAILGNDYTRLNTWGIAIAVAIIGTYALDHAALITLSDSMYLSTPTTLLATLCGALIFGFGMALVGTCGYGTLARIGGGDLKSVITFLVMGITAYATMRGATAYLRLALFPTSSDNTTPSIAGFGAVITGSTHMVAYGVGALLVGICITCNGRLLPFRAMVSGVLVGLCIVWGWLATGYLATDEFLPYPLESFTFSAPLGDTIVYFMTMTGSTLKFGIGATAGVILGALFTALATGQFRWEASDDARELRRQIFGGMLMGFGGVTALGCTVGQGLSAASTLSVSAPIAIIGYLLGAWTGLKILVEGSLFHRSN